MARGNESELMEALADVPNEEWSTWRNKGGFTLLELGESRNRKFTVHKLQVKLGLAEPAKAITYTQLKVGNAVWYNTIKSTLPDQGTVREIRINDQGEEEYLISFWSMEKEDRWLPRPPLSLMGRQVDM